VISETTEEVLIVMEKFNGYTLEDLLFDDELKMKYRLSEKDKNKILYQIAVTYCHLMEPECIIHRDIKPNNILVNPTSHLTKVCNFGQGKCKDL